ncbi:MAG: hypothetical protein U9Q99_00740 [Nanoarchaeota archaeon]|nr:hypothetical protein [Nanoarchaeota archaeon]
MKDIFRHKILCEKCEKPMQDCIISRNGFNLRAKNCIKCNQTIIHPEDKIEYENFIKLKQKEFNVKMRMVGNSYSVSIPREIVDFMQEQENIMNNMVRLSFEEAGRLSLMFNTSRDENAKVIKSSEIQFIKNNKPVLYAKEFIDSAHPEKNKKTMIKNDE